MKDPLVEVLKTATPEQARLVHRLLSGWTEDMDCYFFPDESEEDARICEREHLTEGKALLEKLDAATASFAGPLTPAEQSAPVPPKCELNTHFCSGECIARYKGTKKADPEFNACIACIAIMRRRGLKVKQVR